MPVICKNCNIRISISNYIKYNWIYVIFFYYIVLSDLHLATVILSTVYWTYVKVKLTIWLYSKRDNISFSIVNDVYVIVYCITCMLFMFDTQGYILCIVIFKVMQFIKSYACRISWDITVGIKNIYLYIKLYKLHFLHIMQFNSIGLKKVIKLISYQIMWYLSRIVNALFRNNDDHMML